MQKFELKNLSLIFLVIVILFACSENSKQKYITPFNAIHMAANAADANEAASGVFSLTIKAVGNQGEKYYLNSELDYRDQRNLTIVIPTHIKRKFVDKHETSLNELFIGKHIIVKGMAKRVKIHFYSNGKITPKYYYQTHVIIDDINQIKFN